MLIDVSASVVDSVIGLTVSRGVVEVPMPARPVEANDGLEGFGVDELLSRLIVSPASVLD